MKLAPVGLILPPLSTFDIRGNKSLERETRDTQNRIFHSYT